MTSTVSELLQDHPVCLDFSPECVARLAAVASEATFQPGEFLFRQGKQSSDFYLLISGSVALELVSPARTVRLARVVAGEVLGWSALAVAGVQPFQAHALDPVHVLAFDGARLRHACDSDGALGQSLTRAVMPAMAEILNSAREELSAVYTPVGA